MTLPTAKWRDLISVASTYSGVPEDVIEAAVMIESEGNPNSHSPSDARGLLQLIPRWHRDGVGRVVSKILGKPLTDSLWFDPEFSLRAGALHLRWCYDTCQQSWESAMAKYLSGECAKPADWTDALGTTTDEYVRRFRNALADVRSDRAAGSETSPVTDKQKPYILVFAGHRNTTGGNATERSLTDDLARADVEAFRAAGYRANWYQRDIDGDSLPTETNADLTSVAVGARKEIEKAPEDLVIMLDDHYNGPHSPFHVIVPDNIGLRTAFAGGAPAADTAANNTLDVRIATAIANEIKQSTGLSLLNGKMKIPGLMSETETGVALEGNWRLGMFAATAGVRMKAVRLVVEHGGYLDVKQDQKFFDACAAAKVRAVSSVLGIEVGKPDYPAPPEPEPAPEPAYPFGLNRATIERLFGTTVAPFDPNGPVSNLWLSMSLRTGLFPELVNLIVQDGVKYYVFSSGEVIVAKPGEPVAYLG
jgi:hypothetical protein